MRENRFIHILLTAALILCTNLAFAQDRNLLPKYGGLPKIDWQKAADENFLAATDEEYHGDRKKASMDVAAFGWQSLRAGDYETAMRRFNQAWLLNNDNGNALWGMGAIEASWGKFDDSLKLFAEAEKLVGNDINFSVDHAKSVAMAGVTRSDKALLKDAFHRFERNYKKAPQNTLNLQNWAIGLFYVGKYTEAWEKIKLVEATSDKDTLDPKFVEALQSRMPRPKN